MTVWVAGSRYLDAQFQPYQQAKMIASITTIDTIADMIDMHIFMNFNIIRNSFFLKLVYLVPTLLTLVQDILILGFLGLVGRVILEL